jgi:Tfp pilus assembly protein PilP
MKSKSLRILTLLLLSLFLLLTGVVADVVAQQDPVDSGVDPSMETAVIQNEADHFTYSPKGRRDPFKPLIQEKKIVAKTINGRPEKLKGPLEKFELSQYRLIALVVVNGTPRAMVKAPDGKSYTVKVGSYIGMNSGLVKTIETKVIAVDGNGLRIEKSPDRIVVEEIGIDTDTGQEVKTNRYIVM